MLRGMWRAMTRSRWLLGALLASMAAPSLPGPRLSAEEKRDGPLHRLADVVEKMRPSIVLIYGSQKDAAREETRRRSGLGVIIDLRGIIVAPRRLIATDAIEVVLSDGRKLTPKIVFSDADLAVLKVKCDKPLASAAFGESDRIKVGDFVASLDSMFPGEVTVERGIIAGRTPAGDNGVGQLHMDSAGSFRRARDLLIKGKGQIIGIWTAAGAVPSEQVRSTVRRLLDAY
jgi:S1-C subfamily serine protease